jgi:hypothetical protein
VEHRQTLIAGRLAPGASPLASLPSLVRLLRRRSEASRLSGGLLFDGEWVVMLFEGESASIAGVLDALAAAPQLDTGLDVVVDRRLDGAQPAPTRWIAGYAEPELLDALRRPHDGEASTLAFKQALGASDAL